MTLIRNIIMALAVMFFLGVAGQASAKTLTEIDACKDAALMAAPFTGSIAKREVQARHLDGSDTVLIEGSKVSATRPIWNLCEGPSLTEQLATANRANKTLRGEVARLTVLAYKSVASHDPVTDFVTSGTTYKEAASAAEVASNAKDATIKSEKFFGKLWLVLGSIALALLGLMIFGFSRLLDDHARLQRRMDALKAAPPEESTLGKMNDEPTPAGSGAKG